MEATPERILTLLVEAQTPLSLVQVADALQMTAPPVHRQLQRLVASGQVERTGAQKRARYSPRCRLHAEWSARLPVPRPNDGRPLDEEATRWVRVAWTMHGAVDWRFPLVSRIVDARGRQAAWMLLQEAWKEHLLGPDADTTLVAFGSCVRGDARNDSDLDILVMLGAGQEGSQYAWELLATGPGLAGMRGIGLVVCHLDDLLAGSGRVPPWLRRSILEEGVTIWTGTRGIWLEALDDHAPEGPTGRHPGTG